MYQASGSGSANARLSFFSSWIYDVKIKLEQSSIQMFLSLWIYYELGIYVIWSDLILNSFRTSVTWTQCIPCYGGCWLLTALIKYFSSASFTSKNIEILSFFGPEKPTFVGFNIFAMRLTWMHFMKIMIYYFNLRHDRAFILIDLYSLWLLFNRSPIDHFLFNSMIENLLAPQQSSVAGNIVWGPINHIRAFSFIQT